ncbi:MAG TPA: hypothetical protein VJ798_12545 [Rhizomicrobium sp.]|nr:hypothetical protein [Rhizomicrobium sp.]
MTESLASRMREASRQKAEKISHTWESRTQLVKDELAAASAANDAKTARLRALRLEKEAAEAAAGASAKADDAAPAPAKKKAVRRINCG